MSRIPAVCIDQDTQERVSVIKELISVREGISYIATFDNDDFANIFDHMCTY